MSTSCSGNALLTSAEEVVAVSFGFLGAIHAFGGTLIWLLSLILFSDILFITMCIVSLAGIVPGIAISVRRLHDLGYSGAWLLIWLLPFGGVILLIAHFMDGNIGPNRYGEDPKGRTPVTLQGNA